MHIKLISSFLFALFLFLQCSTNTETIEQPIAKPIQTSTKSATVQVGAANIEAYLPLIKGKKIAMVVNQTSRVGDRHVVDSLLALGVRIQTIFAPEHGFRGEADAGEKVADGKDASTGIPLTSLYGKNKKPSSQQLVGLDWVIFDIQDVGARFYTYISTMHYVMQTCAEEGIPFMVLDRPNPNGHYVDGPIRQAGYQSFVGMHTVPIVHGMTVGEYAQMVNEEGWLEDGRKCELTVIPCQNYTHTTPYTLPVKPSPNLPNNRSIYLYPSLCLFEGTTVSAGRGTTTQFQVYGHPDYTKGEYTYTPISRAGAKYPKHQDKACNGYDLTKIPMEELQTSHGFKLSYLMDFYKNYPNQKDFFLKNNFFDKLAGTDQLRKQILAGQSAEDIRATWQEDLTNFKKIRTKYLLYP